MATIASIRAAFEAHPDDWAVTDWNKPSPGKLKDKPLVLVRFGGITGAGGSGAGGFVRSIIEVVVVVSEASAPDPYATIEDVAGDAIVLLEEVEDALPNELAVNVNHAFELIRSGTGHTQTYVALVFRVLGA